MAVIGIITQNDNTIEIEEKIKKYDNHEKNLIIINEDNAENIKHVKFDVIVIFEEIEVTNNIKEVTARSKYIIVNSDFKNNLRLLDSNNVPYVITYGFSSKATITIISNENDEIILDIQREIENISKKKIESQEIKLESKFGKKHIYEEIAMKILEIMVKI